MKSAYWTFCQIARKRLHEKIKSFCEHVQYQLKDDVSVVLKTCFCSPQVDKTVNAGLKHVTTSQHHLSAAALFLTF